MKQAVMRHKARLKAEFVKAKIKVGAKKDGLVEGEEERKSWNMSFHWTLSTTHMVY